MRRTSSIDYFFFLNAVESTVIKTEIARRSRVPGAYKSSTWPSKCFYQMRYGNQ